MWLVNVGTVGLGLELGSAGDCLTVVNLRRGRVGLSLRVGGLLRLFYRLIVNGRGSRGTVADFGEGRS